MTDPNRILRPSDFGAFETELEKRFELAFGFAWTLTEDSPEQAQRRKEFKPLLAAAQEPRSSESPRALALMRDCYDLQRKLDAFVSRADALADEAAGLTSRAFAIGGRL